MPGRVALIAVVLVTALRLLIAAHVPLTEDEAYYWSWSLHPAWGYVDHPPGVMATIVAFRWLGSSPLAIRCGFILAGALAALLAGGAARELSGEERAATVTTVVFAFIPQLRLFVGEALPDGPYLLCWTAALYFCTRFARCGLRRDAIGLGIALGAAMLSRFFGVALFLGVLAYALLPRQRTQLRAGLWIAFPVALALYAPNLIWNATHHWINVLFSAHDRQSIHGASVALSISTVRALIYATIIFGLTYVTAIRPRYALLAWTALPLPLLLVALSPFEAVESYWLLGPLASLVVATGIAVARLSKGAQTGLGIAYAVPSALAVAAAGFPALPEPLQAALMQHVAMTRALYSPTPGFALLAPQVASRARALGVVIASDRYEVAAELLYHGVPVEMFGRGLGAAQWKMWQNAPVPADALVVRDRPFPGATMLRARYAGRDATTLYLGADQASAASAHSD